ncbi:hypothetical protein JXA32_03015 [Candidatus Sumerlaeota bacterium]|nr:hypothetical protein [Candidatus Sumerlaeota bacterium]
MSQPIAAQITFTLVFHALWWIAAIYFIRLRKKLYDYKPDRPDFIKLVRRSQLLIMILYFALPLVLLAVILGVTFSGRSPEAILGGAPRDFMRLIFLLPIPFTASILILIAILFRQHNRYRTPCTFWQVLRLYFSILPIIALSLYFSVQECLTLTAYTHQEMPNFPLLIILIALLLLISLLRRRIGGVKFGLPIEMEACPLRDEIERIAHNLGFRKTRIRIQPMRRPNKIRRNETYNSTIRIAQWWRKFSPQRFIIPIEIIQRSEPEAFTAGLACALLLHSPLLAPIHRLKIWIKKHIWQAALIALCMYAAWLSFNYWLFNDNSDPSVMFVTAIFTSLCFLIPIVLLAALVLLLVDRNIRRNGKKRLHLGVECWIVADPFSNRTPFDFFRAVHHFNMALNPQMNEQQTASMMLGMSAVHYYLNNKIESEQRDAIFAYLMQKAEKNE